MPAASDENIEIVNGDTVINDNENQESLHSEETEHTYKKYFATVDRLAIPREDLDSHCIYSRYYNSYYFWKEMPGYLEYDINFQASTTVKHQQIPMDGSFMLQGARKIDRLHKGNGKDWMVVLYHDTTSELKERAIKFMGYGIANLGVFALVFQVYGQKTTISLLIFTVYLAIIVAGLLHYLYATWKGYNYDKDALMEMDREAKKWKVKKVSLIYYSQMDHFNAIHFARPKDTYRQIDRAGIIDVLGIVLFIALHVLTIVYLFKFDPVA